MGRSWPTTIRQMVQIPVVSIHAKGSLGTSCVSHALTTPKQHFQISQVQSWCCSCLRFLQGRPALWLEHLRPKVSSPLCHRLPLRVT